jgi:hypothetical protein
MQVTVYNSAGAVVGTPLTTSSNTTLNVSNLAADTYRVLISPTVPATSSLQVTLEPQVGGALPPDGTSVNIGTTVAGENAYFSFSGTAGQNLTLALSNLVVAGISNARVFVTLSKPDGSILNGYNRSECWTNGAGIACEIALLNLPQSGTYTVNVAPDSVSQTMNFAMTVSADVTGVLTSGTALPVTLNAMGQSALLSLTATAGQTFAVNLALCSAPHGCRSRCWSRPGSGGE